MQLGLRARVPVEQVRVGGARGFGEVPHHGDGSDVRRGLVQDGCAGLRAATNVSCLPLCVCASLSSVLVWAMRRVTSLTNLVLAAARVTSLCCQRNKPLHVGSRDKKIRLDRSVSAGDFEWESTCDLFVDCFLWQTSSKYSCELFVASACSQRFSCLVLKYMHHDCRHTCTRAAQLNLRVDTCM